MKPLNSENIQAFLIVVEQRSFTEAARRLNLSKSVVSKRISDLERELGTQLLRRSTRTLMPTDTGQTFYDAALESMRCLTAAADAISEQQANGLRGKLRITAPVSLTQYWLGEVIAEFVAAHPNLHVTLELDDKTLSIEAERFDVAIRMACLSDSALVARRVGVSNRVLVCSPSYIREYGAPGSIDDIRKHRCLCNTNISRSKLWSFRGAPSGSEPRTVSPTSVFTSNSGEVLRDAAVRGVGLAMLPAFAVARDLEEGRLVRVLSTEQPDDDVIHAVYSNSPFVSYKLRAFVEHVRLSIFLKPCEGLTAANVCRLVA